MVNGKTKVEMFYHWAGDMYVVQADVLGACAMEKGPRIMATYSSNHVGLSRRKLRPKDHVD